MRFNPHMFMYKIAFSYVLFVCFGAFFQAFPVHLSAKLMHIENKLPIKTFSMGIQSYFTTLVCLFLIEIVFLLFLFSKFVMLSAVLDKNYVNSCL